MGGEFKLKYAKRYLPFLAKMNAQSDVLGQILKLPRPMLEMGASNGLRNRQEADIKKFSVPALCHYEDRNSMAHSLEIRLPFLDFRLVNFSLNLPNQLKIKNGVNKQILRRSMKELPKEIRTRFDKKGFTINEKGHQNEEFIRIFKQNFKESALADIGAISMDDLNAEFKNVEAKNGKLWERDLHRLLFAEIWAKKFL